MKYQVFIWTVQQREERIFSDMRLFKQKILKHRLQEIFSLQLTIHPGLLNKLFLNRTINLKKEKTTDIMKGLYRETVYWFNSQNMLLANRHSKVSWFHAYIFNVLKATGGYQLWPLITVLVPGFLKKLLFI